MRHLLTFVVAVPLLGACTPVSTDRILAGDFARAVPEFQQADPRQVISYAPLPGSQRFFSAKEIGLWAVRLHVAYETHDVQKICFERTSRILTTDEIQLAIRAAVDSTGAQIEVLDFSRSGVPPGRLEFKVSGASYSSSVASSAPILWRGHVLAESGRSFPIWAKVRVLIEIEQLNARVALSKGQILEAGQVNVTPVLSSEFAANRSPSIHEVIGRVLKRDIAKGEPIPASALEEPRDVLPGEMVHVEAQNGQAQISFEAKSKTGGRRGDLISMQNPINGRTFQALIVDKGKVQAKACSK